MARVVELVWGRTGSCRGREGKSAGGAGETEIGRALMLVGGFNGTVFGIGAESALVSVISGVVVVVALFVVVDEVAVVLAMLVVIVEPEVEIVVDVDGLAF